MQEESLVVPTTLDPGTKNKVNISADIQNMEEVIGVPPVMQGRPEIRRSLAARPQQSIQPMQPVKVEEPENVADKYAAFKAKLTIDQQPIFEKYTTVEHQFPKGLNAMEAMKAKIAHGDIYFLQLASGPYVFRSLTSLENKAIKAIKGMTQEKHINHVVATCVIMPQFSIMTAEDAKLAGTKETLYEQILAYSDYATDATVSIKL